ncbi:sigma factor-like helix-turn-helix DNA-binding protein [Streptomyces sp. NPDC101393]|uniref:sigma factor-like helix-turn-helix DNA-binding protein n=1 Tax=Streptomyces sp. NPDC101393 TaxID=3366141 RepID=UPI00380C2D6F
MGDREGTLSPVRFGAERTQPEIGAELGLSRMHVSCLLAGAYVTPREGLLAEAWTGADDVGCCPAVRVPCRSRRRGRFGDQENGFRSLLRRWIRQGIGGLTVFITPQFPSAGIPRIRSRARGTRRSVAGTNR